MHKFKKRLINNNDINHIVNIADKQFNYAHMWNDFFVITSNKLLIIYYCRICNIKYLKCHSQYFNINDNIRTFMNRKELLIDLKYNCDEWIIKNIID